MKTITLGKEGNQPFAIKGSYVSRHHAQITIDDNGAWTLRDLNSTNGTYIRNETTGKLIRITQIRITPMTFISLGSDNTLGCSFYARQVTAPGNFNDEFLSMRERQREIDGQIERVEKRGSLVNIAAWGMVAAIIGIVYLLTDDHGSGMMIMRMGLFGAIPRIVPILFNTKKRTKRLRRQAELFRQCPNPECQHVLSQREIEQLNCAKCHCH